MLKKLCAFVRGLFTPQCIEIHQSAKEMKGVVGLAIKK